MRLSREHASIAIKAAGISCASLRPSRAFSTCNAINIGLPILESDEAAQKIANGDVIEVIFASGVIVNNNKE
jgi:3-isopropylmalate/(R)-2-methylmalate dehydratase small subunit